MGRHALLLALVAWEVHARGGPPLLSLGATLLWWVTLEQLTRQVSPDVQAVAFLAWSVPLALALLVRLAAPDLFERPRLAPRRHTAPARP